jgi:hypothetical protein
MMKHTTSAGFQEDLKKEKPFVPSPLMGEGWGGGGIAGHGFNPSPSP